MPCNPPVTNTHQLFRGNRSFRPFAAHDGVVQISNVLISSNKSNNNINPNKISNIDPKQSSNTLILWFPLHKGLIIKETPFKLRSNCVYTHVADRAIHPVDRYKNPLVAKFSPSVSRRSNQIIPKEDIIKEEILVSINL